MKTTDGGRNIHYEGAFDDETGDMRATRLMWAAHITRLADENLERRKRIAELEGLLKWIVNHYGDGSASGEMLERIRDALGEKT
jgi:hypothetical protein